METKKQPELIDHIGWDLWQAREAWRRRFARGMIASGYPWFGEARARLVVHIDRQGTRQKELAARSGLSKQAIQQFVDDLERDGVLRREACPDDARQKIVKYTDAGMKAFDDANKLKVIIEREYEQLLGSDQVRILSDCLRKINAAAKARPPK